MGDKIKDISNSILQNVGGEENIKSFENCMTRVRLILKDNSKLDKKSLEKVDGVMGVVESGRQIQVIVGPSVATKVSDYIRENTKLNVKDAPEFGQADEVKAQVKSKYKAPLSDTFKKIADIFIPLIPAFIGSGLIMGINNILVSKEIVKNPNLTGLLGVFAGAVFGYMAIMVGMNAARVFGGSPAIGGLMAGITISPGLANVELFGKALLPGRGGIIAVLLVVWFSSLVERKLRKVIP